MPRIVTVAVGINQMIDQARRPVKVPEDLARVVVAIDPSGTKGKDDAGDMIGIVVAGKGRVSRRQCAMTAVMLGSGIKSNPVPNSVLMHLSSLTPNPPRRRPMRSFFPPAHVIVVKGIKLPPDLLVGDIAFGGDPTIFGVEHRS